MEGEEKAPSFLDVPEDIPIATKFLTIKTTSAGCSGSSDWSNPISPYLNETLRGAVQSTWLRGQPVYQNATFAETPRGRELKL